MIINICGRRYDLKKPYLVLYIFFYIFAPPIMPINSFHLLFFYTLMILIFKYYKSFYKMLGTKLCRTFFMGYAFLLGYVVVLMVTCLMSGRINLMNEVTQLYRFFMVVIELPVCAIYIVLYCKKNGYGYSELIKLIIASGLIQSVFTIMMVGSSSIKAAIVGYMSRMNGSGGSFLNMSPWEYARRYNAFSDNLQDALGWGTGIIAALALFISLYYQKKYFWTFLILLLVPLFNSVTGIVFAFVASCFILLPYFIRGNLKAIMYIVELLIAIVIITVIIMNVSPFVFDWVSRNIMAIGKMGKGDAAATSFGHLMNESNWRFPENPLGVIFGTGHNVMGDAEGYHHADPGLTNNIWLMGVLGTTYLYGFWLVVIRKANKRIGNEFRSIFISLWVCLILFEIKGLSNFYNPGLAVTVCLIFSTLVDSKEAEVTKGAGYS